MKEKEKYVILVNRKEQNKNKNKRGKEMKNKELIKINKENKTVSARELHEFLEIGTRFDKWFERMISYGFDENIDFRKIINKVHGQKRARTYEELDYEITVDMAKELSMIQRTEKGKQARKYFIECEKKLKEIKKAPEVTKEEFNNLNDKVNNLSNTIDLLTNIVNTLAQTTDTLTNIVANNNNVVEEQKEEEIKKDIPFIVKNDISKPRKKEVVAIVFENNIPIVLNRYTSQTEAAVATGLSKWSVNHACNNNNKTTLRDNYGRVVYLYDIDDFANKYPSIRI